MLDTDPINLHFTIPATDHLGKKELQGQLRFHADHIDLHWRLKGNVFTGGPSEMTLITIPYPSVAEVDLKQKWLRPSVLLLRLEDPSLVAEVPNIEVGRMLLTIDKQSKAQIDKLKNLIDFRRSMFLLDETNKRLESIRS